MDLAQWTLRSWLHSLAGASSQDKTIIISTRLHWPRTREAERHFAAQTLAEEGVGRQERLARSQLEARLVT